MKKILQLVAAFIVLQSAALAQTFQWANQFGGTSFEGGNSVATDASGNVYTTGFFQGTLDFDPGAGTFNLSATAGGYDIFISKLDASGNFIWAKKLSGTGDFDEGISIALDASGNVYTTGLFEGTADFDPGAATFNLTSAGGWDIFISKLDASGNFVWAKQLGGTSDDYGTSIAVTSTGIVHTTGTFEGTADFDPGPATFNITAAGLGDIFISKLDASGNFVWAKQLGGTGTGTGLSIALDASGNVYTTGGFSGTVDFDPGAGIFNLTPAGVNDIFISKLDVSGNFVWAKRLGGLSSEDSKSIAVDASGNVYTTGPFYGTGDFDPGAGTFNLTPVGFNDIYISKLDASGNFVWAKQFVGTGSEVSNSIFVDASGNVYTTGFFNGTDDFDPGAGTFNLTATGLDGFISKLDASGNFVWAKQFTGTGFCEGKSLTLDASGNVYSTGSFDETFDFDPGAATVNLTATAGSAEIFISKLNSSGNFVWAKQIGGIYNDQGNSIAVDASGNVYTTGIFDGTVDFDPGASFFSLTAAGVNDIFITKSDASGNFVWAKQFVGTAFNHGISIAVDASGNVYTTGFFNGTADFDPGAAIFNLTSPGGTDWDIFISKLNSSGNFVWAKQLGGTNNDQGHSIAVDASGNVYTTGRFSGTADFDPGAATFNLTSAGNDDIFISKLDASGNFIWAKQSGGTSGELGSSIAVDASGNVYTTGSFQGTADFDPGAGIFNLSSAGSFDIFISKLDASGNFIWAKRSGGTGLDQGFSIALNASGNVHITGYFQGTVDFDPGAGTFNLTSAGSNDVFISKLDASGNFIWAKQSGGTVSDIGSSITVDASGNVYTTGVFQGTADFDPGAGIFNLTSAGSNDVFISKLDASGNFVWAIGFGGTGLDFSSSIAVSVSGNVHTTGYFVSTVDFDPGAGTFNLTAMGGTDVFIHKLSQAPTLTVTINQAAAQPDPTSASPINFTVVFSETVTGFATGDVTLSGTAGATTAIVTGSGTTYNVAVSGMTGSGTVIATIPAGVAVNGGGTGNLASTSTDNTVTYNVVDPPPTVTINQAAAQPDPTSASPINFTVVFNETVTGFATGDVTLSGTAGATTAIVTGSGTTYNVAVSGMTGSGTVIANVPAGVAIDAGGNPNLASTSTDNTVTFNAPDPPPTVTINQAAAQPDPTSASPINFTVVFNEVVTGFATGDVTLSGTAGATTAIVTGSGTTYNVAVSGMTGSGTVIANVPAGVAIDAGGNPNLASTSTDNTVTYNAPDPPPTVTINQAAAQPDPTSVSPINFTVVFNETVTGFATGDVVLSGTAGATTAIVTGSGTTYNVAVSGMTGSGTVIANVPAGVAIDAGGNPNLASTSTDNTVTYNAPDPPPTVTINQAAAQPDPTSVSPINFTVVFNETVTGFATGDVTLSGTAGATTAIVTGSGTTYNVAVSGMTGSGTVIANVPAGVAIDAGGNPNLASTSTDNTVTYNAPDPPPTVTINQAAAQPDPTSVSPINFTVVFNETVTGFATGDVTLSGTAGATTAIVTGSGTTYNVAVSGMTGSGTVIANVPTGVAIDAGGNPNLASTSTDNTVQFNLAACTLTCPANIIVSNNPGQCGAIVNYPAPTTTGSCGTVTSSPASGSFFPVGITTVTVVSTAGPTCSFTIRVNDVQPPSITCPANIIVNSTLSGCSAVVNYALPTVSDNCPGVGVPVLTQGLASGSTFPLGTTTVSYWATDAAGNTATCSFTVQVVAPEVNQPANQNHCAGITVPSTVFTSNIPGATFTWSRTNEAIGLAVTSGTGNIPSFTATNSGTIPLTATFTVVANNGACAGTPKQFTIRISLLSTVTLNLPFDTLYQNSPLQSLSGGSPAGGVFSGTGVSGTQINPGGYQQGNYILSYRYTDPNGCFATATDVFTVIAKANRVNVFPVPSDGNLKITISPEMVGATVRAYDTKGQKVADWIIGGKLTSYQFKWAAGVYSLEFTKGIFREVKTIIIGR